jgi:hypothetical protein
MRKSRVLIGSLACLMMGTAAAQWEAPTRIPTAESMKQIDPALVKQCELHYSAMTQKISKTACQLGLLLHKESGAATARTECGKTNQTKSPAERACLVGVTIADDTANNRQNYATRLKLCQDHYPLHSELDAYLQESCLIGVYLAFDDGVAPGKKPKLDLCSKFSSEKSFLGPCGAGLGLAFASVSSETVSMSEHNRLCTRYFDHKVFHQGYRACLNAHALSLTWDGRVSRIARDCGALTSAKHDDIETAACVVGANIHSNLSRGKSGENTRFQTCGENKVSWTDRNYLVCLTAASLIDFSSLKEARNACKDIFPGRRNKRRGECSRAVETVQASALHPSTPPEPAPPTAVTEASRE